MKILFWFFSLRHRTLLEIVRRTRTNQQRIFVGSRFLLNGSQNFQTCRIRPSNPQVVPRKPMATDHISTNTNNNANNETQRIDPSQYVYPNNTPVLPLDAVNSFHKLTFEEQHYAHFLSKACWFGSLIVLYQTSPESPLIFALFRRLFAMQSMDELKSLAMNEADFSEPEWRSLLMYVAAINSNMGNYRGYGNVKFIPNLPADKLDTFIKLSAAYRFARTQTEFAWNQCRERMFSLNQNELFLGFPPNGTTMYWSKNMTENDVQIVKQFLQDRNVLTNNTRMLKDPKTGEYVIRFASVLQTTDPEERDYLDRLDTSRPVNGHRFRMERGDYSPLLYLVNRYLGRALHFARDQKERSMIQQYIVHFRSGSLEAHQQASRFWVENRNPIVECYLGFIEKYRDPSGLQAEFEGFVAMSNQELGKKFTNLVDNAGQLLALLPWPKEFEKDCFLQPDFSSLDVFTYSGSCVPAGKNIPNYHEIRQTEGFKNSSMGNVIAASSRFSRPNFLNDHDAQITEKYGKILLEVNVGLHELLGHGSGKLFMMDKDMKPNFDADKTFDPLTGRKIQTYYKWNECFERKFGPLSSAYEECRAECVQLYLSLYDDVWKLFHMEDGEQIKLVQYNAWVEVFQKGIESLKMFDPNRSKWLQAHSQARYVILRVLLTNAKDLVNIDYVEQSPVDGKPDIRIDSTRDIELIKTKGKKVIGDFLLQLQVYKSTGDVDNARKLFDRYSVVNDDLEYPYLKLRAVVLARQKPRRLFVQSSTQLVESVVQMRTFLPKPEGLIHSFLDHMSDEPELDSILIELWKKDANHFY